MSAIKIMDTAKKTETIDSGSLKYGDVVEGKVVGNHFSGLFMKTWDGIVYLDDPSHTWPVTRPIQLEGRLVDIEITVKLRKVERTALMAVSPRMFRRGSADWRVRNEAGAKVEFVCHKAVTNHNPTFDRDYKGDIELLAYTRPVHGSVKVRYDPDFALEDHDNENDYAVYVNDVPTDTFGAFDTWLESLGRTVWLVARAYEGKE